MTVDKAMLSRYGMLAADGIYSMAYRALDIGFTPIASVHLAAFPRFCQLGIYSARNSMAFARKILNKTVVISLITSGGHVPYCAADSVSIGQEFCRQRFGFALALSVASLSELAYDLRGRPHRRRVSELPYRRPDRRCSVQFWHQSLADSGLFMAWRRMVKPPLD